MSTRAWITAQLAERRLPSLDLALLTHRGLRYATSRLWFVYASAVLRTAVHAAELLFTAREFPMEFVVPLLSIRAGFGLGGSLSWGLLEGVRRRVREDVLAGRPQNARIAVEAWSTLTLGLGLAVLAGCSVLVGRAPRPEWGFAGLYGSYVIINALGLTVELWSRGVHAGAYALGRVYRPRWSMLAPDLLELGLLVGLWQYLGTFALGASLLLTSLGRSALTVFYARRAYRKRRLPWPRFLRVVSIARIGLRDVMACARGLLGSVPNQLDRVLLMVLLAAHATGREVLPIAVPYYALRPVAGIAQGWARTYYVDLVRMEGLTSGLFRVRLERLLRQVSMIAGVSAGATLVAGAGLLFGSQGMDAAIWLVPLCVARAHLADLQIRAVAYARTDALLALSLALVGVVIGVQYIKLDDRALVTLVTAALVVVLLLAHLAQRLGRQRRIDTRKLTLGAWLAELSACAVPVRVHVACVSGKLARPSALLHQLEASTSTERCTRLGRMWILWWEKREAALSTPELAVLLSGTCESHGACDGNTGWDALNAACKQGLLPNELSAALRTPAVPDAPVQLRERFLREVPDAFVVDAGSASGGLAQLPEGELAQIRRALVAEAREQHVVPRRAPWQVAVYAPRGMPTEVFVWRAHTPGTGELRRAIVHAGWRDSLPRKLEG